MDQDRADMEPLLVPEGGLASSSTPAPEMVPITSSAVWTNHQHRAQEIHVWKPSDDLRPPTQSVLSEEYFVPTAAEAQKAFAGQVSSRERLTDGPLLTKALRQREDDQKRSEKYARFPLTRIRIRFWDRTMLEGAFVSSCTMADVYQFVTECLNEDYCKKGFCLYQTPPRREFASSDPKLKSTSLLDLQLAPSSLLYIKFTDDHPNQKSCGPPLLPSLLDQAQELPTPPMFDNSGATDAPKVPTEKRTAAEALKTGAKVPKWLRNMKKK